MFYSYHSHVHWLDLLLSHSHQIFRAMTNILAQSLAYFNRKTTMTMSEFILNSSNRFAMQTIRWKLLFVFYYASSMFLMCSAGDCLFYVNITTGRWYFPSRVITVLFFTVSLLLPCCWFNNLGFWVYISILFAVKLAGNWLINVVK